MNKTVLAVVTLAGSLGIAGTASAAHDEIKNDGVAKYTYWLNPVQAEFEGVPTPSGTTKIMELPNGNVKVEITASDLVPNTVHAMHLHDKVGAAPSTCPGPEAGGADGIVSVPEGAPSYGGIVLSLTTSGDASAASALALDRYPIADANGDLTYSRQFPADTVVAADGTTLRQVAGFAQVVVHGIDVNANGMYDFDAGESAIAAGVPLEATAPALCGGVPN